MYFDQKTDQESLESFLKLESFSVEYINQYEDNDVY